MSEHHTTVEGAAPDARATPVHSNGTTTAAKAVTPPTPGRTPGLPIDDATLDAILERIASYPELEAFHQDIRDARKAADEAGSDHPL